MIYQLIVEIFNHFIAPHKLIYLLLAVVNVLGIIGIIYAKRYKKSMLSLLSWIKVKATITKAELLPASYHEEQSQYMCKYECSYTVNGSVFTKQFCPDNRIRYYNDESQARSEMETYFVGKETYCYYDPKNPSVAVFSLRYSNIAKYCALGIFLIMLLASSMLITPLLSTEDQPLPFLVFLLCAFITGLVYGMKYLIVDSGTVIVPAKYSNGSVRSDVDTNNRIPIYNVLYDITYEYSGNGYTRTIASKPFLSQFKAQAYLDTLMERNGALIRISQKDPAQVIQGDIMSKFSTREKKPLNKYVRLALCFLTGMLILIIGVTALTMYNRATEEKKLLQKHYVNYTFCKALIRYYYFNNPDTIKSLDVTYLEQEAIDIPLVKKFLNKKNKKNEIVDKLTSAVTSLRSHRRDSLEAAGVIDSSESHLDSSGLIIYNDIEKLCTLTTVKKVAERVE